MPGLPSSSCTVSPECSPNLDSGRSLALLLLGLGAPLNGGASPRPPLPNSTLEQPRSYRRSKETEREEDGARDRTSSDGSYRWALHVEIERHQFRLGHSTGSTLRQDRWTRRRRRWSKLPALRVLRWVIRPRQAVIAPHARNTGCSRYAAQAAAPDKATVKVVRWSRAGGGPLRNRAREPLRHAPLAPLSPGKRHRPPAETSGSRAPAATAARSLTTPPTSSSPDDSRRSPQVPTGAASPSWRSDPATPTCREKHEPRATADPVGAPRASSADGSAPSE